MRASWVVAVLIGSVAVSSTAAGADLQLGKKIYGQKCASCHASDGKGNTKMEQALKAKIPDLTTGSGKSDAELVTIIAEGKRPMPGFGKGLSKDELQAVLEYTKSLTGAGK